LPSADLSGRARTGIASFYAKMFFGRKMADGTPMDPDGDNAASRTLPLGTRARVTNLTTGRSSVVTIKDRGPYVMGRIVDLSPATAREIGITPRMGLAKVEVTPIFVPLPDGRVRWGEGSQVAVATGSMRTQ
jgi:rare lipoprotein A